MTITRDIQTRVQAIIEHQSTILHEREDLIPYIWTNRVAQQHILLVGGPGTAKTMIARNTFEHITGGYQFETSFDETSDPSVAFGSIDVKSIAEGKGQKRLIEGMLPQATDAFLDEIFNANGPTLRSMQPQLNERVYHQGREAIETPLRSMIAGTNQLTTEVRLKALWDRIHQRHEVEPIRDRDKQILMVAQMVERMDKVGRGRATEVDKNLVTVSVDELDVAHHEALGLPMSDDLIRTFFELREQLKDEGGISVSDRRAAEGMVAVLANAWVRGHEEVVIGDLDVLVHMWWTEIDHRIEARRLILETVNPADKFANDGFEMLKDFRQQFAELDSLTGTARNHEGVEITKNVGILYAQAEAKLVEAGQQGWPDEKLKRLMAQLEDLTAGISAKVYGLAAPGALAGTGRR